MVYLALEILWFLLAAAAIGFAVGWLCRSAAIARRRDGFAMQARAAQGELEGQRERLEARLAEAAGANKALQDEVARLRQAADADAKTRRKLEREHNAARIRLEAREREAGPGVAEAASDVEKPGDASISGSFVRQK